MILKLKQQRFDIFLLNKTIKLMKRFFRKYWVLLCDVMQWMPLIEFVEQPLIQEDSMFKKIIDIFIARLGKRYCGLSTHQMVSKFDGKKTSSLYYNVMDSEGGNCVGE